MSEVEAEPRIEGFPRPISRARLMRAVAVEVTGNVVLKAAVVLQTVVVARLYAPTELGEWNTALLAVAAVSTMTALGLDRYLLVSRDRDLQKQLDVAFTLSLGVSLVGAAFLIIITPFLEEMLGGAGRTSHIVFLSPLVAGVALTLPSALLERQLRYATTKVAPILGALTLVGVAAWSEMRWNAGVAGLLSAQLASFVVSTSALWMLAPARPRLIWRPHEMREQLRFGGPLLVAGVAVFIGSQGDDVLVRLFGDDRALGLYTVAFYLPGYLLVIVGMIARVATPALASIRDSAEELREAFNLLSQFIAIISVLLGGGLALFAGDLVLLLYGPQWLEVVPLVRLFSIAFILRASTGFHWDILVLLFDRTRYLMWASFWTAGFLLIVAPPLIWRFGMYGGAVYSLLQLGIMGPLVRLPLIRQTLGSISYLKGTIAPLFAGLCATLACLLAWWASDEIGATVLSVSAYTLTFFCVLMLTARSLIRHLTVLKRLSRAVR